MMAIQEILNGISGGRVLDLATGRGGFALELASGLRDYSEIIGVDSNQAYAEPFRIAISERENISFQVMDAAYMEFPDESFDTVTVSNSLHHFAEPLSVLGEMMRVLRPGGWMIVAEMVRNGQTDIQMTHVLLHHWWAEVDRLQGIVHKETYSRDELSEMVGELGLTNLAIHEFDESEEDPRDPQLLVELDGIIDTYIGKAEGNSALQSRGEELRTRVHKVGFHNATRVVFMGRKGIQSPLPAKGG